MTSLVTTHRFYRVQECSKLASATRHHWVNWSPFGYLSLWDWVASENCFARVEHDSHSVAHCLWVYCGSFARNHKFLHSLAGSLVVHFDKIGPSIRLKRTISTTKLWTLRWRLQSLQQITMTPANSWLPVKMVLILEKKNAEN